ncbi:MAG TPA: tetratricopeptide repeat protein, partial [Bacteroidia bacterium]|nr:tetratricopeptide repeat protein [Bacteroidia bacterium]
MKRILCIVVLCGLLFHQHISFAQSPESQIANYLKLLKADKEDTNKVNHLKWLCYFYRVIGKMDTAIKLGNEAMDLATMIGSENGIASAYCALGLVYWNEGNYSVALDHFFRSLKIYERVGNMRGIGVCNVDIGNIYANEGEYAKSIAYYFKALKTDETAKDSIGLEILNQNIGECYAALKDNTNAFTYYTKAMAISKTINYKPGLAGCMNAIGNIYYDRGNYSEALDYFTKEEKLSQDSEDKILQAGNLGDIGKTFLKQKSYADAERYFLKAIALADSIHYLEGIREYNKNLSDLYHQTSQWEKAFGAYTKYTSAKDSLFNIEKNKLITSNELNYTFEKKAAQVKAEQDRKDVIVAEEKKKQQIVIYAVSAILLLVLLLSGFILRKNRTIEEQKKKVVSAYGELREKHKEIVDSINYAKRIQQALFKDADYDTKLWPEHYILFKPRNVVSGDFYWRYEQDGYCYIAAVDCTGHGVPGAFLTMLGSAFLNEICSSANLLTPAAILNQLRDKVVKELSSQGEVKDGMDISLCRINTKTSEMQWAGANTPLWYLHKGELIEVDANKQPIGYQEGHKDFTNRSISLDKNDTIYLFTDGYADQFGGPKGKKLKYNPLRKTLKDIASLSVKEQKQRL